MATNPVAFLKETIEELKKVVWPNQQEVVRLTIVVLLISTLVGVFIGGLDALFVQILNFLVKR